MRCTTASGRKPWWTVWIASGDSHPSADQSNALSGEITVTVAAIYPNGTMLVQGQKRVTLNRGDEFVQIRGLIRRADPHD